eukprot:evm.model.NODE_31743_length_9368_cov_32.978970.3
MARPSPYRLLSLLLWFVLASTSTASASTASSYRKRSTTDGCFGKFTPARTPLKIPTGSAANPQDHARQRVFTRDILHDLAHTIREHPAQTAILTLMVYIKLNHPELAKNQKHFFQVSDREIKALGLLWLICSVDESWYAEAANWLKGVWTHTMSLLQKLLHRLVVWWKGTATKG